MCKLEMRRFHVKGQIGPQQKDTKANTYLIIHVIKKKLNKILKYVVFFLFFNNNNDYN